MTNQRQDKGLVSFAAHLTLGLSVLILAIQAHQVGAERPSSLQLSKEEWQQRARQRLYPGGPDESDLIVKDKLPEAQVKVYERTLFNEVLESMKTSESED